VEVRVEQKRQDGNFYYCQFWPIMFFAARRLLALSQNLSKSFFSYSFRIDKYRVCAGDFGTKQFFVEINFAPIAIFPRLNFPGQTFYIINTALCDHLTTVTKTGNTIS